MPPARANPISNDMDRPLTGPAAEKFEAIAAEAIADMPAAFREQMTGVVVRIEEFASAEQLAAVEMHHEERWYLTGLYEGRPLTEESVWESGGMPPVISLFRQPLLLEMRETGVALEALVKHVVIHEAGHHFGFSDEEMHALEDQVE